ncbi:MAG: HNH endonuclease [Alphaproteobacteria bacterium]
MTSTLNQQQLFGEFIQEWSLEKLQNNLTLETYTNLDKENSFTYWIEHILKECGSIKGGSSYKFGIYKTAKHPEKVSGCKHDGDYAWLIKYGETREEAFETVKSHIINIAQYAAKGEWGKIDEIDLGPATKWKIAFHYQRHKFDLACIFNKDILRFYLDEQNIKSKGLSMPQLYAEIKEHKGFNTLEGAFHVGSQIWASHSRWKSRQEEDELGPDFIIDGKQLSIKESQNTRRVITQKDVNRIKVNKGYKCEACKLVFKDQYGAIGKKFIELHHLKPVKDMKIGQKHKLREYDFAALCANCHRMIHRMEDVSDLEGLRDIIKKSKCGG